MKTGNAFFKFCGILVILLLGGWFLYHNIYVRFMKQDIAATSVDKSVFRPYILGSNISFAKGGNSSDFIDMKKGWSVQELEHRCMVGTDTFLYLYIPDSVGENLRLTIDGYGVYPMKTETCQNVDVFMNGRYVKTWCAGYNGPFTVDIPTDVITDNTLVLHFKGATPYSPPGDIRKITMAVRNVKIERNVGVRTKRKIGAWIKEKLMGGGIKQEYDTDIESGENWL